MPTAQRSHPFASAVFDHIPMVLVHYGSASDRFGQVATDELGHLSMPAPAASDPEALRRVGIPTVTDIEFLDAAGS